MMRSSSFPLLFLFVLPCLLAQATATDLSTLVTLSRSLTLASQPLFCVASRLFDIGLLQRRIEIAVSCRLGGRTEAEYEQLRKVCRTLSRKQAKLSACGRRCSREKRALLAAKIATAREACAQTTLPATCYNEKRLRVALAEASAQVCPPFNSSVLAANRAFKRAENARIAAMGLTPSRLTVLIVEPPLEADSVLIALHGTLEPVSRLLSYVRDLHKLLPRTRIVLPQAETRFVRFFNGTGPAWFDIFGNESDSPQDEEGILKAAEDVRHIADIQRKVYGMTKVGVIGLSQGGAVAMTTYLRHKWDVAVGVATYVPLAESYPAALTNDSAKARVLMLHGTEDALVKYEFARQSVQGMKLVGRKARLVTYVGEQHSLYNVIGNVIKKVGGFVERAFERV